MIHLRLSLYSAERFEKEAEQYLKRGNNEKANCAKGQAKENREKAEKYKGQEGW